ncbi:solute carrier family 20 [Obelidium mucronatum]|nr:solute carrier family 20 [Obelidium mucronatum]
MPPVPIPVHSYTWIFALTVAFSFLDAYAIGANDVANSFATSVGSRSLKLWQACCIAIFTEFIGAIALGASTTGTIKDGIIALSMFDKRQDLLMSAFMCALIGSSTWVMTATRFGWPVSTTHSIVGAIIGVGISAYGTDAVNWAWEGKGVAQIVASWLISPAVAALLAALIYVYFVVTTFIVAFYVVSKNGKSTLKITAATFGGPLTVSGDVALCMGIVGGMCAVVLIVCLVCAIPYFIRKLEKEEDLKCQRTRNSNSNSRPQFTPHLLEDGEKQAAAVAGDFIVADKEGAPAPAAGQGHTDSKNVVSTIKNGLQGTYELAKKGLFMDVAGVQSEHAHEAHAHATIYDNKVEFLFSFLPSHDCFFRFVCSRFQRLLPTLLVHLPPVHDLWSTGKVAKNATVETWMLAMGGIAIDLGLALYGWRIMINLGNNLTYHSPSRGFAMELGAALSVITASFLALPVSTTQCIVGATIGVGLMNGTAKAINWKMVSWTLFSWLLTLPVAGVSAGCLYALLTRGSSFN